MRPSCQRGFGTPAERKARRISSFLLANVPGAVEEMSINIKSPVVLNPKTKIGRQVILQNSDYKVRYQPFLNKENGGI